MRKAGQERRKKETRTIKIWEKGKERRNATGKNKRESDNMKRGKRNKKQKRKVKKKGNRQGKRKEEKERLLKRKKQKSNKK